MIAYLNGKLTHKTPTLVYLDVNGLAYLVNISLHTYAQIEELDQVKMYTHLIIKEDSHTLYGFFDQLERDLFIHLISVSGIGGNTARVILSYLSPKEVQQGILHDNVVAFNKVKGVGPKTAKRIILDLKDKMAKFAPELVENSGVEQSYGLKNEAISALQSLGFQKSKIEQKIDSILAKNPDILNVELLIKEVLKQLS